MNLRNTGIICLFTTFIVASCAIKKPPAEVNYPTPARAAEAPNTYWAGRIGLQISSDPPQAFFAGFEMKGRPERGELALLTPLGSTLGVMRWTPTEATLEQGGSVKLFASTDELLTQLIGAAVPMSTLFDWLSGVNSNAPGWLADLSEQANGRIVAKRTAPLPQADLRILLDK